ncbi:MAG: prenyltransferase, partial [Alistipes sp.]|nr:prenyltransferase [Alistipes sp.]
MEQGALWAYNLNYMDWLGQENLEVEERAVWLDRFVQDLSTNRVGLDPYPIALRGINWVKFISTYWEQINPERRQRWLDSLYAQYELLTRKLEFHLLGNHLLEDLYSLFIAALFFR